MAKKEKEETIRLHNRGKREVLLKNGVKSEPNKAIDVPKSIADFYVKAYPRDFIYFDDLVVGSSTKNSLAAAEKKASGLEKENEKLKKELEALKAAGDSKK